MEWSRRILRCGPGRQSLALAAIASIALSGVLGQLLVELGMAFTEVHLLVALVLSISLVLTMLSDLGATTSGSTVSERHRLGAVVIAPVTIAVMSIGGLAWSSWKYTGRSEYGVTLFPQFGMEDNAKWLNVISDLAEGGSDGFNLVGGVTAIILRLTSTVARVIVALAGEPIDGVGTSVLSAAIAQWILVALTPLSLIPAVRQQASRRPVTIDFVAATLFAGVLLTTASLMATNYGHLTAQLVILGLSAAGSLGLSAHHADEIGQRRLARLLALLTMSVWLPLHPIALIGVLWVVVRLTLQARSAQRVSLQDLCELIAASVVAASLIPSLRYVAGTDVSNQLAAAGGATNSSSVALLVLAGVVSAVAVVMLQFQWRDSAGSKGVVLVFLALSCYTAVARMNDFRVSGSLNYGSTKLLWVVAVLGASVGVVAIARDLNLPNSDLRLPGVGVALIALALPSLGSTEHLTQWVRQFDPGRWPAQESGRWHSPEVLPMSTPISTVPIGCVVKESVDSPSPPIASLDSYLCTRFLSSVAGLERDADPLIRFGLGRMDWATMAGEIEPDSELRDRDLIVLNADAGVIGRASLGELIDAVASPRTVSIRLAPNPPTVSPDPGGLGVVEAVDLASGTISGWLSPAVSSMTLTVSNPVDMPSSDVVLSARPDVVSVTGPEGFFAGFSFAVDPAVHGDIVCIIATTDSADVLLWGDSDAC